MTVAGEHATSVTIDSRLLDRARGLYDGGGWMDHRRSRYVVASQ